MKVLNVFSLSLIIMAMTFLGYGVPIYAQPAPAQDQAVGGVGTGGGDECERRVKEIQTGFIDWIERGEHKTLILPPHFTLDQYTRDMKASLRSFVKISCPSRKPGEESAVMINGVPKTCEFDSRTKPAKVKCDIERFLKQTSESGQYRLIHHEHAGLIGLEPPNEDESSYSVSDQIAAYLGTFLKLTVKNVGQSNLKMFGVADLTREASVYKPGEKLRFKVLRNGTLFKGTANLSGKNLNDAAVPEGPQMVRVEQIYDGINWQPVQPYFIFESSVQELQRKSMIILKDKTPMFDEVTVGMGVINQFDKGTNVRGWTFSPIVGDTRRHFIFVEEYYKDDKWHKLEQPGFVRMQREE